MKSLLLVVFVLVSMSGSCQNMQQYLTETRQMVQQKKYKEALERQIWFHEHALEHSPSMSGVRLSYALDDWKALGKLYPPALIALQNLRDAKTKTLLDKKGDVLLFGDVAAINRTLNENTKTITLFETITQQQPNIKKGCWIFAQPQLFAAKRYDIIQQYIGNPLREMAVITERYYQDTAMYHRLKSNTASLQSFAENNFVEKSLQLIQFSMAMKDPNAAKQVQAKALGVVSDYRLQNAISANAK